MHYVIIVMHTILFIFILKLNTYPPHSALLNMPAYYKKSLHSHRKSQKIRKILELKRKLELFIQEMEINCIPLMNSMISTLKKQLYDAVSTRETLLLQGNFDAEGFDKFISTLSDDINEQERERQLFEKDVLKNKRLLMKTKIIIRHSF